MSRVRLTHLQPETHCPRELTRTQFSQIAADVDVDSVHARLLEIRDAWDRHVPDTHPTKRAMVAAGVDYTKTGYAILSLCLPSGCSFRGRNPDTDHLVALFRRARHLPRHTVAVEIDYGLFLGGFITSDALTGLQGLMNHIYQNHGPAEGLRFVSRIQRLTTCVSLYGYCSSVGLDDCLLPSDVRASAHRIIKEQIDAYTRRQTAFHAHSFPYIVDEEATAETEIERLVKLRTQSEEFITRHVLGQRSRTRDSSAMSADRLNQIALLAMLATKGSVPSGSFATTNGMTRWAPEQPHPMLPRTRPAL